MSLRHLKVGRTKNKLVTVQNVIDQCMLSSLSCGEGLAEKGLAADLQRRFLQLHGEFRV